MNVLSHMSAPRVHVRACTGIAILSLMLAFMTACAPAPKVPDARPSDEPVVSRLVDGRQGFRIEERNEMDEKSRSDFVDGVDFMEQARYDEAIVLLLQVIERSPELTAPHVDIALAYEQIGETEKAEEQLKTALVLIPGHPVASNVYGLLLRKQGRFAEAREIFEMSLERFPEYLPTRKNLGILYELYLGDVDAALEQYEIYSEAAPEDEQVTTWIASLRLRIASE